MSPPGEMVLRGKRLPDGVLGGQVETEERSDPLETCVSRIGDDSSRCLVIEKGLESISSVSGGIMKEVDGDGCSSNNSEHV